METACDVYTKLLWQRGHGHPLWEPEPTDAGEVLIGDVGHIYNGGFYRIFNATLPGDHPVNRHCAGVPEDYTPFTYPRHLHQRRPHALPPGPLCSKSVLAINAESSLNVGSNVSGALRFKCADEQGAVLILKHEGDREVLLPCRTLTQYILHNHPRWYQFARDACLLGIREEDLIFVRGWVKTGGWAVAAATHSARDGEIGFSGNFGAFANAAFTVSANKRVYMSVEHRTGPMSSPAHYYPEADEGGSPKFDQCVFLHYYKLKRRRWPVPRSLKAAADEADGPTSDGEGSGFEGASLLATTREAPSLDDRPPHTAESSQQQLAHALKIAREAVTLDSRGDDPLGAVTMYARSAALLREILERATLDETSMRPLRRKGRKGAVDTQEDRRRLKSIHDTYTDRMNRLCLTYDIPLPPQSPSSIPAYVRVSKSSKPKSALARDPTMLNFPSTSYLTPTGIGSYTPPPYPGQRVSQRSTSQAAAEVENSEFEVWEESSRNQTTRDPTDHFLDYILEQDGVSCALVCDEDLATLSPEMPADVAQLLRAERPRLFVDADGVGMLPVHDRVLTSESKEPAPPLQTPLADVPMPLNPANATDSLAKFLQAMPTQQLEASGDISQYTDNNGAALQEKEGRI